MESLDWDCTLCLTKNAPNAISCQQCEADRPLPNPEPVRANPVPGFSDQHQVHPARKPVQLFSISNDYIRLNHEALGILDQTFEPNKPICVLNVAGHLGVGKTTWLNQLLYLLEEQVNHPSKLFKTGHSQQTETQGLWIFPYPLTFKDKDIQYLLVDMEGTEGIVEGDAEAHENAIRKLFFLVFTLSSVFTLHTGYRVDRQTVLRLGEALSIAKQLKEKTQIDLPDIIIMVKDCEVPRAKNGEPFGDYLKRECNEAQGLGENFQVIGRPKPCDGFLEALKGGKVAEAFDLLEGRELDFNLKFLEYCSSKPKTKPGSRESLFMKDFIESTKKHAEIINCDQYKDLFKETLDQKYVELVQPIKEMLLAKYETDAEALVANFSLEKELSVFQESMNVLRTKAKDELKNEIKKKLSIDIEKNQSIMREMAHFTVTLKNNRYDISFLFRKSEHTNAQKQQEYLNQIAQLKQNSEGTKTALNNLAKESKQIKTTLEEQIKGLKSENEKKEAQHQKKIQELQSEINTFQRFESETQKNREKTNELEKKLINAEAKIADLSQCANIGAGGRCTRPRGHGGDCTNQGCNIF